MALLDSKKSLQNLKNKGFVDAENKGNDHIRVEFWYNGRLTRAKTKFSHSAKDIDDYLIGLMSKQVCLTKRQFIDLAKCPLSQEEFIVILRNQGFI